VEIVYIILQQIYSGDGVPKFTKIVRVLWVILQQTFWSHFFRTHQYTRRVRDFGSRCTGTFADRLQIAAIDRMCEWPDVVASCNHRNVICLFTQ